MLIFGYILWCVVAAGLLCFIAAFVVALRCTHPANALSWPQHGKQVCHMCQRVREYKWDDEQWTYDLGKPGAWHKLRGE